MLTETEREILQGEREVKAYYKNKVTYKARKKAKIVLKDLGFLAEFYPEAITNNFESLTELVSSILKHGEITLHERHLKRGPIGFGARREPKRGFIKIGGVLRKKSVSPYRKHEGPLKKPEIHRKARLAYDLLRIMHCELTKLPPFEHIKDVVELELSENGEIKIRVSTLDEWVKRGQVNLENAEVFVIKGTRCAGPE